MDHLICEFVILLDVENGSFHLRDFRLEVFFEFSDLFEENVGLDCGLFERCLVGLFCPFMIILFPFMIILSAFMIIFSPVMIILSPVMIFLCPFKPIIEH